MKPRDYKFGFEWSALVVFAIIMLPNFIWFFVTAPNDVLKEPSATPVLDAFVTVFQVLLLFALCALKNKNAAKLKLSPMIICSAIFCVLYYGCWILYFCGIVHASVLIFLCMLPCLAFLFYGLDRKNFAALIPIVVFAVLHLTSTAINFL